MRKTGIGLLRQIFTMVKVTIMVSTFLALTCGILLNSGVVAQTKTPRKPSPFAPSLPELTEEEEAKYDEVIDKFIEYDTGKLKGPEGRQALTDFQKLGNDAIPALIRGLNRAAKIDHSCPAVTIAKKLGRMLGSTKDTELLEYARENIGAGVETSRHMGVIKDLRVQCMLRKNAVLKFIDKEERNVPALKGDSIGSPKSSERVLRGTSLTDLLGMAGTEHGAKLKAVLKELGRWGGDEVVRAFATAIGDTDLEIQQLSRDLLKEQLSRLKTADLKLKLKDRSAAVRAATADHIGSKGIHLEKELIELLKDDENVARKAAHAAIVKFAKGEDFGPKDESTPAEREEAQEKWRRWLARQNGR